MSAMKTKSYGKRDKLGTNVRQTGRTGHSLESCPTVPVSNDTRAILDAHDMIAREMELKWGVGRLERLVDETLAKRFQAQKDKFHDAIFDNNQESMQKHGAAMKRAYQALDTEAERLGCKTIDKNDYWEIKHPRVPGAIIRFVKMAEEMPIEKPDNVAYVCIEEMIDYIPPMAIEVKQKFGGSKISPREIFHDDPIPF